MKKISNSAIVLGIATGVSSGQSLFVQALDQPRATNEYELSVSESAMASMLYVTPPEPREFMKHDLVTIIVDETSKQTSSQSLDTKKSTSADVGINALIDPWELLELRLREGGLTNQTLLDASMSRDFKGEGDYERSDKFNARITAQIIEVKPNGTLVLQATKVITKDDEVQTLVLAGVVRQEDITNGNTVLSSQMANLSMTLENKGDVRNAAKKGLLTRVMDAVFNF